ncbi:MAG: hypothetical protein HC897_05940 [Thermoanaerobaculia bacterium]|nr:hypothetical protein [Thermoanaerobaculia bacterium]
MRELLEIRVRTANAERYLPPSAGVDVGYGILKVVIPTDSELFEEVGRLSRAFRSEGDYFFSGWQYHRKYSRQELEDAELFYFWPKRTFEPEGEACGTIYDESSACKHVFSPEYESVICGHRVKHGADTCSAGARQISPLFLRGRSIPRKVDIARTIAGEIVVSARAVAVFRETGLIGGSFDPVRFANRAGSPSQDHFQLTVCEPFIEIDPATRFGTKPFSDEGHGQCPFGHILGLNLLSEVTVTRASLTDADIMATKQLVGVRRGVLRPRPLLLMSPRAWRAIQAAKLKGFGFEVAYIAP